MTIHSRPEKENYSLLIKPPRIFVIPWQLVNQIPFTADGQYQLLAVENPNDPLIELLSGQLIYSMSQGEGGIVNGKILKPNSTVKIKGIIHEAS